MSRQVGLFVFFAALLPRCDFRIFAKKSITFFYSITFF